MSLWRVSNADVQALQGRIKEEVQEAHRQKQGQEENAMSTGPYTSEPSNNTGNTPYVMAGRETRRQNQPKPPMELTEAQRTELQGILGPRWDADYYAKQNGGYAAVMEDLGYTKTKVVVEKTTPPKPKAKKKAAKKTTKKKGA